MYEKDNATAAINAHLRKESETLAEGINASLDAGGFAEHRSTFWHGVFRIMQCARIRDLPLAILGRLARHLEVSIHHERS